MANFDKFLDGYRCEVKVDYSPDSVGCDYLDVLGAHAAKMLLEAFSQGNERIQTNEVCGFSNGRISANPNIVSDEDLAAYSWDVDACVHDAEPGFYDEDCLGKKTHVAGSLSYSGQKEEVGEPVHPLGWQGVTPQSFDSLKFHVSEMTFDQFDVSYNNFKSTWYV